MRSLQHDMLVLSATSSSTGTACIESKADCVLLSLIQEHLFIYGYRQSKSVKHTAGTSNGHITSQLLKKATIDIAPAGWHKLSQATIQQQQLAGLHGCSLLPCPTASRSLLPGPPLHRCQAHHVMHHCTASSCWEMPPSGNCCGEICCYHCPASAHHYTTVSRMLLQSKLAV